MLYMVSTHRNVNCCVHADCASPGSLLYLPLPDDAPALILGLPCSPAGQYAKLVSGTYTCTACPAGYYRSGDASPFNNACHQIPSGYREKTTVDALGTIARAEVIPCSAGTFSSWTNATATGVRTPSTSTICQACNNNLYAPRAGMTLCVACKGGTMPATIGGAAGPNTCTSCATAMSVNTYRNAFTIRCAMVWCAG